MSWFSSSTNPSSKHFSSVAQRVADSNGPFFGKLEPQDLYWTCAGGFVTETQTFYSTLPNGDVIMFQVIHSAVGLWHPNVQLTFAHFTNDPKSGQTKRVWKSINVKNFHSPPAHTKLDKRSSKGDQFSITVQPSDPDTYILEGKYDDEVSVALTVKRTPKVPGWKLGSGPRGGFSYFGPLKPEANHPAYEPDTSAGHDGYVIHRFWPRTDVDGVVRVGKQMIDIKGSKGIMIHAIQGMRPNLVASRWNFANLQSTDASGASLVMMEFTTTSNHRNQVVNVGSLVVGEELVAVTLGGSNVSANAKQSKVTFNKTLLDPQTEYLAPLSIDFDWNGPSIQDSAQTVSAQIKLELQTGDGSTYQTRGLGEKIDVLAEIPYLIKKVVNVVSGAKPYVYQWLNPVEATIDLPGKDQIKVTGNLFNEASYVSETP